MAKSNYYLELNNTEVKERYEEKISIINDIDPYTLERVALDFEKIPKITLMDLVNYLILTHSFYTGQQLKAFKSLEAYKYYEAGFVELVVAQKINEKASIVVAKVKHSQRMREKPLKAWAILLADGSIASGHCTCMAGLSEVCSHVAAILFCLLEKEKGETASTEKLALWPVPSLQNVEMKRVKDIKWSNIKKQKEQDQTLTVPSLSKSEIITLLQSFKENGVCSVLNRIVEPFASEMEDEQPTFCLLNQNLTLLYNKENENYSYGKLISIASHLSLSITTEESKLIEERTRDQRSSQEWYLFKSGRISASVFKRVCHTSIENPSLSVIKSVCYPQKINIFSKQIMYGVKHEKEALSDYEGAIISSHRNLNIKPNGFFISTKHPELGASPDALVECECCGSGVVEVKCPYILKNCESLEEYSTHVSSCLVSISGELCLDKKHAYYYQIQLQMFVTQRNYCDFVVWSKQNLFIERHFVDLDFCSSRISLALDWHNLVIKPELLGRYFTKLGGRGAVQLWCFCQKPDDGRPMIMCECIDCDIQWFHFHCVELETVPDNLWYCKDCIINKL